MLKPKTAPYIISDGDGCLNYIHLATLTQSAIDGCGEGAWRKQGSQRTWFPQGH